jgi:hypothetical protein
MHEALFPVRQYVAWSNALLPGKASYRSRFFGKSIWRNRVPETAAIDKSGANLAALHAVNVRHNTPTKICQIKYLTT